MSSWYDLIQQIKVSINKEVEEIPSLSDFAKQLGYSYFYLAKKFHQVEGISFREYTLNQKIHRAASDIYYTSQKIINIAVKYGYSSQEAFTRAFVRVYGITPALYRKLEKPTPTAQKSELLGRNGFIASQKIKGVKSMKLYVKQMFDWNCYAYYAENVDKQYWEYFKSELWWQVGNSFIKQFDNLKDFKYCAANFTKYGDTCIKQQLKLLPSPWENALSLFIAEINKIDVDWYVHGSAAMALWGIDVAPKELDIIILNYSDFDKVRNLFYKYAIKPIERCDNWIMSGLGNIFMEAVITLAFHNKEVKPYDMSKLGKIIHNGQEIYISSLQMLKQDNDRFGRPDRVAMIEEKITDIVF